MKKNDKKRSGVLYYIAITIMVIILVSNIGGLIVATTPAMTSYYEVSSPEELLRKMDFSGYQRMLEYKKINEALGVSAETNKNYVVPYAICDYYENGLMYKGYSQAGNEKAAQYKKAMEQAKSQMGEYASLSEDIDAYLKLED